MKDILRMEKELAKVFVEKMQKVPFDESLLSEVRLSLATPALKAENLEVSDFVTEAQDGAAPQGNDFLFADR